MSPEAGAGGPVRRPQCFDDAAEDYDRYRPAYPEAVVDAVVSAGGLGDGTRVLEIGCGTGQLSLSLVRRGVVLLAVEMGARLAARARRNLAPFPTARVEVAPFETWARRGRTFDAVVSASAFHWLAPEVRFAKAAAALRPGGSLVLVHVHHVGGGTPGFFEDTQPIYMKWGASDDPRSAPPAPADAPPMYPELERLSTFGPVQRHRLELARSLPADAYVGWLRTDSLVLGLDPAARRGLLADVERLIRTRYAGEASRNFVYEVIGARRTEVG